MHSAIQRLTTTIVLLAFATSIFGAAASNGKIEFRVIVPDKSYFPSYTTPNAPAYLAIHSAAEWVAYWSVPGRLSPPVPFVGQTGDVTLHIPDPDVDFSRFTLLLITDGPKPNGGYSTAIRSIWYTNSSIRVTVINVSPVFDNTCAVTLNQTEPIVIALIPKADRPIVFDVIEATTKGCSRHRAIESGE